MATYTYFSGLPLRKLFVLTLGLITLLLLGAQVAGAKTSSSGCFPKLKTETLKANSQVRVFKNLKTGKTYACSRITGQKLDLHFSSDFDEDGQGSSTEPTEFKLHGSWLAIGTKYYFYHHAYGDPISSTHVVFYNLGGRTPKSLAEVTTDGNYGPDVFEPQRFLLTSTNQLVVYVSGSGVPKSPDQVILFDSTGKAKTLDAGQIERGSLAVTGNLVTWTSSGQPRSAPL